MTPPLLQLLVILTPIMIIGWFWRRHKAPRRIEKQLRDLLARDGKFNPGRLLGRGREGFVFQIAPDRAIKVIYSRTDRNPSSERTRHEEKLRVIREGGLDDPPFVVGIHCVGEINQSGEAYPFQVCELINGRTLQHEIAAGTFTRLPFRERLLRLINLTESLEKLERHGLNFVHIDDCNLMIDSGGRWRLIDFDALEIGKLDFRTRKRFIRRLARVILGVLGPAWRGADFGGHTPAARAFFERLAFLERITKRVHIDRSLTFKSVSEIRSGLVEAHTALKPES